MNILLIDTETSPNSAFVWGLWDQNIALSQLIESSELLCYAAKWYGDDIVMYSSKYYHPHKAMLQSLWDLLDAADVIVHFNGNKFDIPVINREFLRYGFKPPSPSKQVDLYQVAKSKFRFASNKLDYICQYLGLGKKNQTNFQLWVDCMNGDEKAWMQMEKYNKQDVVLLEKLYNRFKPWITTHPNVGAYIGEHVCPNCGSRHLQRRGVAVTTTRQYQRYVCKDCGHWSRAVTSEKSNKATLTHAVS